MSLKGRHFLSMMDYTAEELWSIIRKAVELKQNPHLVERHLSGKHVALMFQKPSTRTRISFEVAVSQMGGRTIFLHTGELQLKRGESIADTARTLQRFVQGLVVRFASHRDVEELAAHCSVPVVNGLSNLYHPCQALSDMLTLHEKGKDLKQLKLTWVGDGNNVCNSLMTAVAKFGGNMTVACPRGYEPAEPVLASVKAEAAHSGADIRVVHRPEQAVEKADVIYTDTFISMGQESQRSKRLKAFLPKFQVTRKLLEKANRDVFFMHCLPAHRGEEVEAEVIDGPRSIVWDQTENRLYLQKALLALIL